MADPREPMSAERRADLGDVVRVWTDGPTMDDGAGGEAQRWAALLGEALAEVHRVDAENERLRPVVDAATEWYEAGGGGSEPDGRLHRANRNLRRALRAAEVEQPDPPRLDDLREEHCYIKSVDCCCFCGDCECDGIACIAALDVDDVEDHPAIEDLHDTLRAGQAWQVMSSLISAGEWLSVAYRLAAETLAYADNRTPARVELLGGEQPQRSGHEWGTPPAAEDVISDVLLGRQPWATTAQMTSDILAALEANNLVISNRAWLSDVLRAAGDL